MDSQPTTASHGPAEPLVASPVESLSFRSRWSRLTTAAPRIALVAVAAMIAYLLASLITSSSSPFFAPIAAVVVMGATTGVHTKRAVQLALGVALGILVADLTVSLIGTGAWQLAIIVFIGMCAVVFAGGDELAVRQAASAAILISVLAVPGDPQGIARFVDALIGSGVALIFNLILFPIHPGRVAARAVVPAFARLASVLDGTAMALESRDLGLMDRAIREAIELEDHVEEMRSAVAASGETASLAVARRDHRSAVGRYSTAMIQVSRAQRNCVGLTRGARRALDIGDSIPPDVIEGLRSLADASRQIGSSLGDRGRRYHARSAAVEAAAVTTAGLELTRNLSVSMIVGQSRLIAKDLMLASGMKVSDAREDIRAAADPSEVHPHSTAS